MTVRPSAAATAPAPGSAGSGPATGVAGGGGADAEHMADEVRRLSLARDRVERRLRERLAEDGVFTDSIGAGAVAAALEPGTAAAGFLRYDRDVDQPLT